MYKLPKSAENMHGNKIPNLFKEFYTMNEKKNQNKQEQKNQQNKNNSQGENKKQQDKDNKKKDNFEF